MQRSSKPKTRQVPELAFVLEPAQKIEQMIVQEQPTLKISPQA